MGSDLILAVIAKDLSSPQNLAGGNPYASITLEESVISRHILLLVKCFLKVFNFVHL